ncbi:hypothetical protein MLD38_016679 [Melastoma candidum]|uniref:Uncharacterized protein n=1 Tax=Melastoma candidum TaxID=119954 RepID=A0ACB9QRA8_9MYRT|nr:hypothetical protein MLD38_016679 [Melastoma candidum]
MDESWRSRIGTGRAHHAGKTTPTSALDPEDFSDVFGGPPRTVLLRKFSADRTSSPSSLLFHGMIPRPPGVSPTSRLSEVFYDENNSSFTGERMSRDRSRQASNGLSKSKSKSNTSSALSSEELSPVRPNVMDDAGLLPFGPKLRPINVPCRWNSTADFPSEHRKMEGTPVVPCGRPSVAEDRFMEDLYKRSNFESPPRAISPISLSPETFTAEPNLNPPAEDEEEVKAASLSSVISGDGERIMEEQDALAMSDEDDEILSSYVIEITPAIRDDSRRTPRIDEAVAWDMERFLHDNAQSKGNESWGRARSWKEHVMPETKEKQKSNDLAGILCSKSKSSQMTEFEALDRNMKSWTSGTEKDIRQLLSTLHQIMWPDSGWEAVPLTNLRESSQVNKAYQKARQCLQPDKLQQRGATFPQKYIAHKALTIIQDSWTKYISEGYHRDDQITLVDRRRRT